MLKMRSDLSKEKESEGKTAKVAAETNTDACEKQKEEKYNVQPERSVPEDIKITIGANIAALRAKAKMTQFELAEKLNYSDKSVSKWERGEAVPDVTVLKQITDMYGVTLDFMVNEHIEEEIKPVLAPEKSKHNRKLIEWLTVIGTWTLATLFFVITLALGFQSWSWLIFVLAVPVSMLIFLIFKSIWGTRIARATILSAFIWSLLAFIYLVVLIFTPINIWYLFFLGIPAQAVVILANNFKK